MAETTGLLNRRTGHSVPRVRISSSPQPATAQRFSAGLFWYAEDASSLVDDVYQNGPNDRQVVGCCMVARTPVGGKRCRKRSAAESRPSSHRPLANQPHIGTPHGHTKRPTSCAKGRYRAMAHRNHPHSA